MSSASRMIFYDARQRRKVYFRVCLSACFIFLLGGFLFIANSIVNAHSPKDYLEDTRQYYDYYFSGVNSKKLVLTFDDGPHPVYTRKIMEVLKKHDVPAMFFLLGKSALKYEDVVTEIHDAGYDIGNHSFTHSYDVHESEQRVKLELITTSKIIENITGERTIFYRPPFLLDIGIDPTINPYVPESPPLAWAAKYGFIPVGVDVDSKDWAVGSADEVMANIQKSAPKGSIILLHDGDGNGAEQTIASLDRMITELKSEGYTFTTLADVLGITKNVEIVNDLRPATNDEATAGRVSELQHFLKQEFHSLRVTGTFDLPTLNALKSWEEKYNIPLEHGYYLASTDNSNAGEVSKLQHFLKEYASEEILVTGIYDKATEKAVKKWQKKFDVVSTNSQEYGMIGSETRRAIFEYSRSIPVEKNLEGAITSFWLQSKREMEIIYMWVLASISPFLLFMMEIVLLFVFLRIFLMIGLLIYSFARKQQPRCLAYDGGVSVIVPAYNEQENVASTLESVIANTWKNKEIIVIDDGSTDNTAAVVKEVQKKYPNLIRLFTVPNGGKANALNVGFQYATHDVVVALDGDTIFADSAIEYLAHHFGDPNVGAVAGKVCVVEKQRMLAIFQSIEYIIGQNIEKWVFSSINAVGVVPGPVGAWRKSVVLNSGGYSVDTLVEDQDLTLAVLKAGNKVIYEPNAIAYTETPPTIRDFIKQRFRWVFGTMQCFWKYKGDTFRKKNSLSWIILPNIAIYSTIVPLFSPLVDLLGIFAIFFGGGDRVLYAYLIFTVMDFFYATLAFRGGEKENLWLLIFLPFQRFFYRQIMYYIILKSVIKAIEGTGALWNKVKRTGQAQKYYLKNLETAGGSEAR